MKSKISIVLFILTITVYPQDDYRILSSDQNSIVIEYSPVYSDTSIRRIDNQEFRNIVLSLGYIPEPEIWGLPSIPERRMNLGVPSEFGNTIEILTTQYIELDGLIIPKPELVKDETLYKYEFNIGDGYFDYVEGVTVNSDKGYIIFPTVEPFGADLLTKLTDIADANE